VIVAVVTALSLQPLLWEAPGEAAAMHHTAFRRPSTTGHRQAILVGAISGDFPRGGRLATMRLALLVLCSLSACAGAGSGITGVTTAGVAAAVGSATNPVIGLIVGVATA
jgi:hypothetical protein